MDHQSNDTIDRRDLARRYIELLRDSVGGRFLVDDGIAAEMWEEGRDFPVPYPPIYTMVGRRRLDNLIECIPSVINDGGAGDVLEAGVWRGGTCILMRGVLVAAGDRSRRVYVADSFEGLPPPDVTRYPKDADMDLHLRPELAVSVDRVRDNFAAFGLLDDRVEFVKGRFCDSLPSLRGHAWAVVRLDGDMYESTMDALVHLYPSLTVGGYLIIDDYGAYEACRAAVHDYRHRMRIREPIRSIDWTGVYWRRER